MSGDSRTGIDKLVDELKVCLNEVNREREAIDSKRHALADCSIGNLAESIGDMFDATTECFDRVHGAIDTTIDVLTEISDELKYLRQKVDA